MSTPVLAPWEQMEQSHPGLVSEPETVAAMWRLLGRQLADLRHAAGLTQYELGALTCFSRSMVSLAEIGRMTPAAAFWEACDKALDSGGVLADGARQINAVHAAQRRAKGLAAQEAREALALAAFTAARDQQGLPAAVTAVQACPHCGGEVSVVTSLAAGG
jgi:hypothetical protein